MNDRAVASQEQLLAENAELRDRLAEAEELLRAVRAGEVDALVVESSTGARVFTLQGADAESSRRRGDMLAQVSDAVVAIDEDERVTYLNGARSQADGNALTAMSAPGGRSRPEGRAARARRVARRSPARNRGKIDLKRDRIELAQAVKGAVETSRPLIEQCGHELVVTLPARPIIVDADPTRLTQVLWNLLNNAAKYMHRGGRIELCVETQDSEVLIAVKDQGVGLAADKLQSVFGMFSQVESSLSPSQGGLGIGLHLVRRLVELHGGSVQARSDGLGQGTEFVIRLPISAREASGHYPGGSQPAASPESGLRNQ